MTRAPPRALRFFGPLLACGLLVSGRPAPALDAQEPGRVAADVVGSPASERFVREVWTVEHGLPANEVTDIVQTPDGYLWLSTFDGLARFDGIRFTVYNTGNTPGLPSNRILQLAVGGTGDLWLITETLQLVRFDGHRFRTFGPESGVRGKVDTWFQDRDGTLWVGTDRDVSRMVDGEMRPLEEEPLGYEVSALLRTDDGALWVGTEARGLYWRHEGRSRRYTVADGLPHDRVRSLAPGADGVVWVATARGLARIRDGRVLPRPDRGPWTEPGEQFVLGPDGRIAAAPTETGLYRIRGGEPERMPWGGEVGWLPTGMLATAGGTIWGGARGAIWRDDERILPVEGRARALLRDHEGSLWIGAQGLYRLKPALFEVYGAAEGFGSNFYPVHEDPDGTLWFGSLGNGLTRRRPDGTVRRFTMDDGLPTNSIYSIHRDRSGTLWLGTWDKGFCAFRGGRCAPRRLADDPMAQRVRALVEDAAGRLWIGTDAGAFRREPDGTLRRFTTADGLSSDRLRVMHSARDGTLWFGTYGGGLVRLKNGVFASLGEADGLSSGLIRAVHEDERGVFWIGTEGRGLNRVALPVGGDLDDADITVYRRTDGLFDDVIHRILDDRHGRFWMSTNRGIFWVAKTELDEFAAGRIDRIHATSYSERDGLRNREANGGVQSAGVVARDGRLWFPMLEGAAVVDPSRIRRNEVPPPVVVEEIVAGGVRQTPGSGPIRLPRGARSIEISYTALSFMAPRNVRFRYRLQGLDRTWVEPGNRRTAFYTNMPPGEYTFHVIAANNDGIWNEAGAAAEIVVPPFFYETGWFRGGAAAALLLFVVSGINVRERRARAREDELQTLVERRTVELVHEKEASETARREAEEHRQVAERALAALEDQTERLRELDEAKSRFFANISHEFRTPLTLTIGPLEDLSAGLHGELAPPATEQVGLALRNARRLLRLVSQILDVAKLEAGHLRLEAREEDITGFVRDVIAAFAALAERKRITLSLDAEPAPIRAYFDADLLEKVLANLLSNAFKFTPEGGEIRVCVRRAPSPDPAAEQDDDEVRAPSVAISVRDSGPGIPLKALPHVFDRFYQAGESRAPEPGTGIGLALARELVELHGGHITAASEVGTGATFTVHLPLGADHLAPEQMPRESDAETTAGETTGAGSSAPGSLEIATGTAATVADPATAAPPQRDNADVAPATGPDGDRDRDEDRAIILIADDNAEIRRYVRRHLAEYRVIEAANGEAALDMARDTLPDIVVSDVMMPGMSGRELCRALAEDPETAYVPVLLLTAKAGTEHKIEALEEGAADYLTKPFQVDELRARIRNIIETRRRLRDRIRKQSILEPAPIEIESADEAFLTRVRDAIEQYMDDEDFDVEALARAVFESRSNLYRKLRDVGAPAPAELIRRMRLERAAQLLEGGAGSIAEIAYGVGFRSVSHFSRSFKDRYGASPSRYTGATARE